MSDLIPFEAGQLPAHLRGVEDAVTKALAGNRGGGLRISIKGCVFRMIDGGKEIAKNEERSMKIVIVNTSPTNARSFYKEKYQEGADHKPPTCWSNDGKRPEADVKDKQSTSCDTCPQNVKGSGQGDSRACRYSRHLAVMLPNDIKQGRVYKLTLPATSIFGEGDAKAKELPLEAYAAMLRGMGVPITGVVTQMKFDTSVSTPKLTFWPVGYLSEAEYKVAEQMGKSKEALDAITTTVFQQDGGDKGDSKEEFEKPPVLTAPATAPADDDEDEEERALKAALEAKRAKKKAAAAGDGEPEVVAKQKTVTEVPKSTADLLKNWDN